MHHTNRQRLLAARWMAGAIVALFPLMSHALGLGKLTVRSALNEPLNAEIEITSVDERELKGLQIGLAPRDAFTQAGIERLPFLSQVKFTVSKRAEGNYFIQLHTDQQIEEPFLHLLLSAEWPGGRLVREYTALIDPPSRVAGKPAGIEAPEAAPSAAPVIAPVAPAPQPQPEPIAIEEPKPAPPVVAQPEPAPATQEPKPAEVPTSQPAEITPAPSVAASESKPVVEPLTAPPASTSSVPSIGAGGYHVKRGDTAWRIAEEMRTNNSYTIEQVVLALYRANPHAFFGSNVNNLKAGQILKAPEDADVESVTAVQARSQFRAQYDTWQEYKIKLAGAASAVKVVDAEPKQAEPATKPPVAKDVAPTPKESDKTAKVPADKAGQQDELLKIVRSTIQGDKTTPDKKPAEGEARKDPGVTERQALADRVATLEESAASRQSESKELGEKIAQVRAQLKREARLIQIEQQDLAAAQARAKPEAAKPVESVPAAKPEVKTEPTPKAEAPKPAETPAAQKPATAPEKRRAPATETPKKPAAPTPPPAEEKGFVGELMESILGGDLLLPILGVAGLLFAGIGYVYWSRRRKSIAEFEESILQSEAITGGQQSEPASSTDTSGQVVSTGDTSFLSDFSQGGMGNVHTDEVDPIAEAEVYLAYGRDETAEEILKEAVVKNPAREEIKLKLLEIYANRSDVRAFETLAEEMYAAMGGRPSKNWAKVEDLGRKLNPENPMFKGGGAGVAAATATAVPNFGDTAKMKATMPPSTTTMADTQTGMIPPPTEVSDKSVDFDFDLGNAAAGAAAEPAGSADSGFDLDLGDAAAGAKSSDGGGLDFAADLSLETGSDGKDAMGIEPEPSNVVDFDFGDKEESVAVAAAPETDLAVAEEAPQPAADAPPAGEAGDSPQWDETATKLDLARAYIDMGDSEGARSILQEVMSEGSEQQKKQATELAAQIG